MSELTPKEIVIELDKYIIGQDAAKKAVAVALRNRYRRSRLPLEMQEEITPKNIIMIGSTGIGKTEIARRLAKLVKAPFVKVEATKFTEVGYVGRDVESMIRDLIEASIRIVKNEKMVKVQDKARKLSEERILEILVPRRKKKRVSNNPLEALFSGITSDIDTENTVDTDKQEDEDYESRRNRIIESLKNGYLEDKYIEIEVEDNAVPAIEMFSNAGMDEVNINMQDIFSGLLPKRKKKRKVTIAAARKLLQHEEAHKLIDMDEVNNEAVLRAEQNGIIFFDEIDKIAGKDFGSGPDVSREGVQRDILPIVEGSTVMTKYGPIKTDYILFISAGAFHVSKISDLIPELQGRFPIRVQLQNLTKEDFKNILTKPENAIIKQYTALLETEGLNITFTDDAIDEISNIAYLKNEETENIGARRLHTVMDKVLQDLSFEAADYENKNININRQFVLKNMEGDIPKKDFNKYII